MVEEQAARILLECILLTLQSMILNGKKSACYSRVLVVTELVVSGTQCIMRSRKIGTQCEYTMSTYFFFCRKSASSTMLAMVSRDGLKVYGWTCRSWFRDNMAHFL